MRSLKSSLAVACTLTLLSGAALADNLHTIAPTNPAAPTAAPGQTGSNVLASCGSTDSQGFSTIGNNAKSNTGAGSPFNADVTKTYAGNPGSPSVAANTKAVSQYDNACAQASFH